jgi:outer membrane protein assembly factor BamB
MVVMISGAVACAGHSTKREAPPRTPSQRPLFPADVAWTRAMEQPPAAPPTADRTHVFVPIEARILAFDRETGESAWAADVATRWPVIPAGGAVYVLTTDRVVELDPATGAVGGQADLPGTVIGPAARDGDVLIIPIAPTSLIAWDVRRARMLWNHTLPAAAQLQPVVIGPTVYAALADGHVAALRVDDGSEQWMTKLTGVPRALAASSAVVAVGSSDRIVYALRPATGALKWPLKAVADLVGVAADDRRVYVAALDNTVRAFDAVHGGAQRWKALVDTRPVVPPQITPDGLLIAGADSRLIILAAATGRTSGTHDLPELRILEASPLVLSDREADRVAVVVTVVDQMIGIRPKPPAPEKSTTGDGSASTPAASPAGATPAAPTP